MRARATLAIALGNAILLAGCAPDAWVSKAPYDQFLSQLSEACYYDPIGTDIVGNLAGPGGTDDANYFTDETSRLFFGKITRQNWIESMTGQLDANVNDRGIQCVLAEYDKIKGKKPA